MTPRGSTVPQLEADESGDNARIVLGLLASLERDGAQSQRRIAADLGIALGLVNAYVKRCVRKGLVKVSAAPPRRYVYYLTPQGFAEKSKLTVQYLSYSFSFFREARTDCAQVLAAAKARGVKRIALAGASDLADIVRICALECGIEIAVIVDQAASAMNLAGIPVVKSFDDVAVPFDAIVLTDLVNGSETLRSVIDRFGSGRIYIPKLLGLDVPGDKS
jgi:DNA-binding MarR family transcriptional regulator